MTEAHNYQLSTAENELGVVIAHSEEGTIFNLSIFYFNKLRIYFFYNFIANNCYEFEKYSFLGVSMIPVSWTEMQCPKTLVKEFRKVAKVIPEDVVNEM